MAGSKNNTHYSAGYNFYPVTASDIVVLQLISDATQIFNVDGNPENNEAANPGSIAMDRTNGALYLKVSGTGNTGWEQIQSGTVIPETFTANTGSATPAANNLNILGSTTTAGSTPVATSASGSTVTTQVQFSQAIASTNAANVGLSAFSSSDFSVDGNGFVTSNGAVTTVWENITASQNLEVKHGYFCTANALSLALPATSAVGDVIEVVLRGGTSWTITQAAGQKIYIGNTSTTTGAGGSLASTADGDAIRIVCQTANTTWVTVPGVQGNITVV